MCGNRALNECVERCVEVRRALQFVGVLPQGLGHSGVENRVDGGNGLGRAHHTELELVAGEGERRGAVAVGHVPSKARKRVDAKLDHRFLRGAVGRVGLQRL